MIGSSLRVEPPDPVKVEVEVNVRVKVHVAVKLDAGGQRRRHRPGLMTHHESGAVRATLTSISTLTPGR
ncbi:MAG TPA: hypothetical protein VFK02_02295 [Kofleriaceae bacterium]|nr:hypothetical protein [Kofleriaceae bacterium]